MLNLKESKTRTTSNRILRLLSEDAGRESAAAGSAPTGGQASRRTS